MEGEHRPQKIAFACILLLYLSGCGSKASKNERLGSVQHGDVICRLGKGFSSNYFRKFGSDEMRFSHIGIIVSDSMGNPAVVHAEASEWSGAGYVSIQTLEAFLDESEDVALYRLKTHSVQVQKDVGDFALAYLQNRTPFDLNFDLSDDAKVYCTELVARCINRAFDSAVIEPKRFINQKLYFGIDDIYKNPMFCEIIQ